MAQETYKMLIFLKRRPGMSLEEFRDYYENRHVPLCLKYSAGPTRYVRRYIQAMVNQATGEPSEPEFDVITEIWFTDRKAMDIALKYAGRGILPPDVLEDEQRVFDRSKSRFTWVVEVETDPALLASAAG